MVCDSNAACGDSVTFRVGVPGLIAGGGGDGGHHFFSVFTVNTLGVSDSDSVFSDDGGYISERDRT